MIDLGLFPPKHPTASPPIATPSRESPTGERWIEAQVDEATSGAAVGIYDAVFGDGESWDPRFERHRQRAGFVCALAGSPTPVGFAYGTACEPEGWWERHLAGQVPPEVLEPLLREGFAFTELAVRREARGHGLGRRLHDAVLAAAGGTDALLTVPRSALAAQSLYASAGWRELAEVTFPGGGEPSLLLHRPLP